MRAYDPKLTPWQVVDEDFPRAAPLHTQFLFLLRYAVLAPSSHNTQPWRFSIADREVRIYADPARWLRVADRDQRELDLSLGCALENLCLAAERFGYAPHVLYPPAGARDELAAIVTLDVAVHAVSPRSSRLFRAIPSRHTSHRVFSSRGVAEELLRELRSCADEEGVVLHLSDDPALRGKIHELVVRADALQFADPAFREELAHWIAQGVFGTSWLMAKLQGLAVAHLDLGRVIARKDSETLMSAPLLGLITAREDDRASRLRAGRVFERLYLMATSLGLALQPISQIVEVEETRAALPRVIEIPGEHPLQPFRLGYAEAEKEHTPRRPIAEVVV